MTIKEIASELGLSASTVSKALNNASDVSADTRNRVNNYRSEEHTSELQSR